jgi:hypothetical protein
VLPYVDAHDGLQAVGQRAILISRAEYLQLAPLSAANQAQPEPKRVSPALFIFSRRPS